MPLKDKFASIYEPSRQPLKSVQAPGRINLIGGHVDYNKGFVLPVAINRYIYMAGRKREDEKIFLYANDVGEKLQTTLSQITHQKDKKWANYLLGVIQLLQKEYNHPLKGMEILFQGDIPVGKGLSSSAALEVATAYLLSSLFDFPWEPLKMTKLCQRAENEFVGMPCGIMDQFICVFGKKNKALFLDCQDLSFSYVPIKSDEANILIADTGVKRELTSSPYKKRRGECETAVKLLQKFLPEIASLRDLSPKDLENYEDHLPATLRKRARHVVSENQRVLKSVELLGKGKLSDFGKLIYESHHSSKHHYEVSCRELDLLVDLCKKQTGVLGARLSGAGFGGAIVSLVKKEESERIANFLVQEYAKQIGLKAEVYLCEVVDGVGKGQ